MTSCGTFAGAAHVSIPVGRGLQAARQGCTLVDLPDLAPWLDNVSDAYHELPSGDHEMPYDE